MGNPMNALLESLSMEQREGALMHYLRIQEMYQEVAARQGKVDRQNEKVNEAKTKLKELQTSLSHAQTELNALIEDAAIGQGRLDFDGTQQAAKVKAERIAKEKAETEAGDSVAKEEVAKAAETVAAVKEYPNGEWRDLPIEGRVTYTATQLGNLADKGIKTLGDLDDLLAGRLETKPGNVKAFGVRKIELAVEAIEAAVAEWQASSDQQEENNAVAGKIEPAADLPEDDEFDDESDDDTEDDIEEEEDEDDYDDEEDDYEDDDDEYASDQLPPGDVVRVRLKMDIEHMESEGMIKGAVLDGVLDTAGQTATVRKPEGGITTVTDAEFETIA